VTNKKQTVDLRSADIAEDCGRWHVEPHDVAFHVMVAAERQGYRVRPSDPAPSNTASVLAEDA
jgi:hypothetical protein